MQLDAAPAQRVSGEASADVVHLLSELVDNALSYSPPSSKVMVTSTFTRGGVIVQVTDGGLGIAQDALAELNEKLQTGGEVTPDTARRMGLFVVSRLAQRHGLTVQLDHNDRMGITATVFLPTSVLSDTARLEAGSGGAQVIELGATQAVDTDEYAGYTGYGESDERVDAEVVAYRRPEPEPEQAPDYDPITAAINAYGLPQRRPGASGAGNDTAPVSMGGGFFDRVVSEEAVPAVEDDVVDAVVVETDEVEEVDAPEEEVRAAIALGPVSEDESTDEESRRTRRPTRTSRRSSPWRPRRPRSPWAEVDEVDEVAEVDEVPRSPRSPSSRRSPRPWSRWPRPTRTRTR